jgi:hypothetical protein
MAMPVPFDLPSYSTADLEHFQRYELLEGFLLVPCVGGHHRSLTGGGGAEPLVETVRSPGSYA